MWKILLFEWILLVDIEKNCKKIGFEMKNHLVEPLKVFTSLNLGIFNSENVK